MSITLLVGSQNQLSDGLPWLMRFAHSTGLQVDALVLGLDHKTLLRHTQKTLEEKWPLCRCELVADDADAVVTKIENSRCRLFVMIDDVDDDRLEAEVFERCGVKSVWINAKHPPPTSDQHVFSLDDASHTATARISKRLLSIVPALQLDHQWNWQADDGGKSNGANSEKDIDAADRPSLPDQALARERQRCDEGDLIWIPFGPAPSQDRHYKVARALLSNSTTASIALVSRKENWDRSLLTRIRYWASHVAEPMDRETRLELARTLSEGSQPNLEFLGLISASAMLAAFGLLQNSAAVIIGAMLIAPLMTPIMGAGLSLAHGNRPLFKTSILTIGLGFLGAFVSSFLFGLLVRLVQPTSATGEMLVTPEMWGRCNPSPLDFCVGLVGGMAASYARTRAHLSSALAGAAIAAALVPPIATAGLEAAFGVWHTSEKGWPVFGPLVLVSVNVLTIMIGTSFVLYARGLRVEAGNKWATRMTVSLVTLVLLVLVWMMHLERWQFS
ncbi:DUF389 domain-containing protein [Neorhodopirellula lusitana]|uniref:DUF389 domain-containing protein n=1 Tax=Neorhodopirellula lusitana TaxID=445327 RepID=UPI00384A76D4